MAAAAHPEERTITRKTRYKEEAQQPAQTEIRVPNLHWLRDQNTLAHPWLRLGQLWIESDSAPKAIEQESNPLDVTMIMFVGFLRCSSFRMTLGFAP